MKSHTTRHLAERLTAKSSARSECSAFLEHPNFPSATRAARVARRDEPLAFPRAPFSTLAQGAETEEQEFSPDAAVAFEAAEPTFMTTLTFSEDGIKAMIDKDIDREKVRVTSVAAARRRTRNARGALTFHPPSSRRPLRFVLSPNRLRERTANHSNHSRATRTPVRRETDRAARRPPGDVPRHDDGLVQRRARVPVPQEPRRADTRLRAHGVRLVRGADHHQADALERRRHVAARGAQPLQPGGGQL